MKWFLGYLSSITLGAASLQAQIYADFETSLGNFTCELNYAAAPKTVANFVGLATGEHRWIDFTSGVVRENTPFYDGLTFHRVIANFMNQSGSRNGLGTDGPGYVFPDETENGLTHQPYVISMANSGTYTNGAQFFITAVTTAWLDGKHTVFGSVTTGRNVIDAINQVSTSEDRPDVPVVIEKVTIRRVGDAANAFDIEAQGVPTVSNFVCDLNVVYPERVDATPRLPLPGNSQTRVFFSENLVSWGQIDTFVTGSGDPVSAPFTAYQPYGFGEIPSKGFFRFARSEHTDALCPQSYANRILFVSWDGGNHTLTFTFNADGTGGSMVYNNDPEVREILYVYDSGSPYDLIIECDYYYPFKISMAKTGESGTHHTGIHKISQWQNNSWNYLSKGTVTLSK